MPDGSAPSGPADPRDPLGLARHAPLFAAWLDADRRVTSGETAPFTIPGHKGRSHLTGDLAARDHVLYGVLAPMKQADALVERAERLAAEHFGADWLRFSVGGSSHGNQALALAVGRPGATAVVSRTLHRSMLLGLVLAGLEPAWMHPAVDARTGVPLPITAEIVEAALAEHPDACAVMLTDPTYVGTFADLSAVADRCHRAGVPLVVDAAWGAHFGADRPVGRDHRVGRDHSASDGVLPRHALAAGADAVVTSAHKTLPVYSQGAYVMARTTSSGGYLDGARLERAFAVGHTTSPAAATLAGLDAVRALLAHHGSRLAGELVDLVAGARARLAMVPGLVVVGEGAGGTAGTAGIDPTKLVLQLSGTGVHGHDLEEHLRRTGVPVEMADRDLVIAIVTMADGPTQVDRLVEALTSGIATLREAPGAVPRTPGAHAAWTVRAEQVIPPREAFFAAGEVVDWHGATGRVSAEVIAPYPPGVPVLSPGERITRVVQDALTDALAEGSRIAYAADPSLATVRVVAEP